MAILEMSVLVVTLGIYRVRFGGKVPAWVFPAIVFPFLLQYAVTPILREPDPARESVIIIGSGVESQLETTVALVQDLGFRVYADCSPRGREGCEEYRMYSAKRGG
jgi:hypothetical protein